MFTKSLKVGALTAALVLGLTGCSSSGDTKDSGADTPGPDVVVVEDNSASAKALDEYVKLEQEMMAEQQDQFGDTFSDISITADYPSGIVYTYTYADEMDSAQTAAALDDLAEEALVAALHDDVFPLMTEYGVDSPQTATFTYLNSDGSEIWSRTYTSE